VIASNTPNFSWGSFSFTLRGALAPLPFFSAPVPRRQSRRDWRRGTGAPGSGNRIRPGPRRLRLKIPELKLWVLGNFHRLSQALGGVYVD